jgi:holo-[acyl-carrier protein] synthase
LAAADVGLAFAQGFAAKEACAKALGTGFADGVDPRDIALSGLEQTGTLRLCGSAGQRLREITPLNHSPLPRFCFANLGALLSCTVVVETVCNLGDREETPQKRPMA